MIDIHTHILPRIDDGPASLAESVAMGRAAAADGIALLAATPHMFCDVGNPTVPEIEAACRRLRRALAAAGVSLTINCAAELRLVADLPARIAAGEAPGLDRQGRYVLLEAPRLGPCREPLLRTVFNLRLQDRTAVIAHPEKIEAFHQDPALAADLVERGALLQVTAGGVVAALASDDASLVGGLLTDGLVHVIASDAHDAIRRPPRLSAAAAACAEFLGPEQADLLVRENPRRLLAGEEILRPRGRPATASARTAQRIVRGGRGLRAAWERFGAAAARRREAS